MATTLTKFKGGAELAKALQELPVKLERNIMRSALRQGANVILKEARSNINNRTGDLAKSLKVSTRSRRGQVAATVKTDSYKAKFVEFGTEAHTIKADERKATSFGFLDVYASVQHPGAKAKPFMRPAMDEKQGEAIVAVGEQIRKRLTKQGLNTPDPLEIDDE